MGVNYPNYYQQTQYTVPYQARPPYTEQSQQFQAQYQFSGLKGRPVASFDEAKASMIDFDGSIFYFPDAANKRIYTKQINIDGTSTLNIYALVEQPNDFMNQQQAQLTELPKNIVLKEEFDATIDLLLKEIEKLKNSIQTPTEITSQQKTKIDMNF